MSLLTISNNSSLASSGAQPGMNRYDCPNLVLGMPTRGVMSSHYERQTNDWIHQSIMVRRSLQQHLPSAAGS